jgi:hypothetical protein
MAAKVTTTSHLVYNLHPRNWADSRGRRNVSLTSKGTRVPKKFDHMKCCARPARNGCSSEIRRDIRSVTGRTIKNDALAQCEALSLCEYVNAVFSNLIKYILYIALAAASPRRSGNSSLLMTHLQSHFLQQVCGACTVRRA